MPRRQRAPADPSRAASVATDRLARPRAAHRRVDLEALEPRALLAAAVWDGDGGDGNWHNPLNWVGDVLPADQDDVTIAFTLGPTIHIAPGLTARARSLDLAAPIFIAGTLDVTQRTTIGDATLLNTGLTLLAGLTLEAGTSQVVNHATLTLSGDCVVRREIVSTSTLNIADGAHVSLGAGLADEFGRIIAPEGTVSVGPRSLVEGLAQGFEHIRVSDLLSLGDGVTVREAGIVVAATHAGVWDYARLEGLGTLGAALVNVSLELDWARVRGTLAISDCSLDARNSVSWTARSSIEGGQLHVRGSMGGDHLRIRGVAITLGDDAVEGSAFLTGRNLSVERSTITLLELSYLPATISDSTITGAFNLHADALAGCAVSSESTVIVSERIASSPDSWASYLNPLVGDRALDIYGRVIVAARVDWDGSSIRLLGDESRLSTGASGYLVSLGGQILGDGLIVNAGAIQASAGTTHLAADVRNKGLLLATSTLRIAADLDSSGTVEARGATLAILEGVAQIVDGALNAGTWKASDGGTIIFPDLPIRRNDATIVADGDSILRGLAALRRNDGIILLLGAGDWIDNPLSPIDLVNNGTIRKEGRRSRNIVGDIRQTKRGVLEVADGRLLLEGSLDNAGIVRIGSPTSYEIPAGARLRLTGEFNQRATGVLAFIGNTGSDSRDYPRLLADTVTLRGVLLVDFDPSSWSGAPRDQWVTLVIADRPRVGTFSFADLRVEPGTGVLRYTTLGVRVRLIP